MVDLLRWGPVSVGITHHIHILETLGIGKSFMEKYGLLSASMWMYVGDGANGCVPDLFRICSIVLTKNNHSLSICVHSWRFEHLHPIHGLASLAPSDALGKC